MDYKIFTTKYDEVVRPLDLASREELDKLSENFHLLCPVKDFEPLRERLEKLTVPEIPTTVTILVDNSGSMRGGPISFAVGAVGIISMYLDRLGIPNEILGFTTTTWRGGQPYEDWREDYRPLNPGRLCALRHIVYKEVNEKLQDVRYNLALMLRDGLIKENVDGEAVQWAISRLREMHQTPRKILLVISDGAPVDDCTLQYNNKTYLSDHLSQVIEDLRNAGDIELDAIGIYHDVSRYYGVGDIITQLNELAPTAIHKLETMLKNQ